jgi:hypothetical protein
MQQLSADHYKGGLEQVVEALGDVNVEARIDVAKDNVNDGVGAADGALLKAEVARVLELFPLERVGGVAAPLVAQGRSHLLGHVLQQHRLNVGRVEVNLLLHNHLFKRRQ